MKIHTEVPITHDAAWYILHANGLPTWAYVLIGIATYEIAKKIIG